MGIFSFCEKMDNISFFFFLCTINIKHVAFQIGCNYVCDNSI